MVIIWGQRMYGRVDRYAGAHVSTRFFHLYYVPLIPISSWLVLGTNDDDSFQGIQVPLSLRSVALAWTRVASVAAGIGAIAAAASALGGHHPSSTADVVGAMIYVMAAIGLGILAWQKLGRLTKEEKAARVVYSDFAGRIVDVAQLGDARHGIKQRATEELSRHLVKHATASYRDAPQTSWRQIATRPDVRDVPLLRSALTRCRVEWSDATGDERRTLERDHQAILVNLCAAQPELLDVERYELDA